MPFSGLILLMAAVNAPGQYQHEVTFKTFKHQHPAVTFCRNRRRFISKEMDLSAYY